MESVKQQEAGTLLGQLSVGRIFVAIFAILAINIAHTIIKTRYFHPLSKFPGPFWASVSRLWITYHNLTGKEHEVLYDLHKKYGPVIRITPTMLMCSDPKMLPVIYHSHADKADHYVTGSFGKTPSVFNIQPHKVHAAARRKIAQPYAFSAIKPMETLVDVRIDEWTSKLEANFAAGNKKFDFAAWATFFAYDVISELAFGKALGFVAKGYDIDNLIRSFHEGLPAFGFLCRLHPFTKWIKTTWIADKYMIPQPGDSTGIGNIMSFRDQLIDERIAENKANPNNDRRDLLQSFLKARDVKDGIHMDDLKAETLLVLLAGSDTTATEFQAVMIDILKNPKVYERLMAEIDAAPLSRIPTYDEALEHCPYYIACVKEAMRLCPAAPNMFPRVVASGGLQLYGKFAPEGTEITCNPYITHRNKEMYGEDAEEFRPERWLDNAEKVAEWEKHDFGFGFGSRKCLGQSIALMELYKAPLQFFRHFRPRLVNEINPSRYIVAGGVSRHTDLWLTIEKRA
ncbi:cytochrome P450 [Pyronema domesticum]|nr:cytochrome P450 [Pyronema domesticum]